MSIFNKIYQYYADLLDAPGTSPLLTPLKETKRELIANKKTNGVEVVIIVSFEKTPLLEMVRGGIARAYAKYIINNSTLTAKIGGSGFHDEDDIKLKVEAEVNYINNLILNINKIVAIKNKLCLSLEEAEKKQEALDNSKKQGNVEIIDSWLDKFR